MRRAIRTAWGATRQFSFRVSLGLAALVVVLTYLLRWAAGKSLDVDGLAFGLLAIGVVYVAVFAWHFIRYWWREPERRRVKRAKETELQEQLERCVDQAKKDLPELVANGPKTTAMTGTLRNPQFHQWLSNVTGPLNAGGHSDIARELQLDRAREDLATEAGTRAAYEWRLQRLTPPPKLELPDD